MSRDLSSNVFLKQKGVGESVSLSGGVLITVVLVDEPDCKWTEADIRKLKSTQDEATRNLLKDAKRYGVPLDIKLHYIKGRASTAVDRSNYDAWVDDVLTTTELRNEDVATRTLKSRYYAKEVPVIFSVNRKGRSFAVLNGAFEHTIIYNDQGDYRHELLHLFGAMDFYYPEDAKRLARKYFPDSIMLGQSRNQTVDALTAYLVGWTNKLSPEAEQFIAETAHITDRDIINAIRHETRSGYNIITNDQYTYKGLLKEGFFHGYGTIVWADGGKYVGYWSNGKMHGQGTLTYNTGDVYSGEWVDGIIQGYGTMVWKVGSKYVGYWANGKMHGQGIYYHPNGQVMKGRFDNHKFCG